MNNNHPTLFLFFILLLIPFKLFSQPDVRRRIEEQGKFDNWQVVEVKESSLLGGDTKFLYKVAEGDTLKGNIPYKAKKEFVWATTNVMANIIGVIKASNSVFYEKRDSGYCAKLQVILEKVRVIGLLNLDVTAQGSLITGELLEPIRDTKSPYSKVCYGIPFTDRPKALQFDYKAKVGNQIIRATGLSPKKIIGGEDYAEAIIILQRRWEDENGNIHCKRVGTGYKRITESVPEWINQEQLEVHYGDMTSHPEYKEYMGLKQGENEIYCLNSKGKSVPIQEEGWDNPKATPTHILIHFSSSHGLAFFGGVGNILWIDNVKLIY